MHTSCNLDYEFDKNICAFCGEPSDEKKFGKFFTSKFGFSVHQYCMVSCLKVILPVLIE